MPELATSLAEAGEKTSPQDEGAIQPGTSGFENLSDVKKLETTEYTGVIPAMIRYPQEDCFEEPEEVRLFVEDFVVKSPVWVLTERKGRLPTNDEIWEAKVAPEFENHHRLDGMYFVQDAELPEGDPKGFTSIQKLIQVDKYVWFSCKVSRTKPDGVDVAKLGLVEMNGTDAQGTFYIEGPPGPLWIWDFKGLSEKTRKVIDRFWLFM
ncbi:hypothetical protein FRB99_005792 [Tulasnella sp. 403]|nr:hypothetical protein FRB99_005792 [Tulasnella sp. 403]